MLTLALIGLILIPAAYAQPTSLRQGKQQTAFRRTGPPPAALGAGPFNFDTAEQPIRVTVVARGIPHPWSLAFLPNGDMLVTERAGRLRS